MAYYMSDRTNAIINYNTIVSNRRVSMKPIHKAIDQELKWKRIRVSRKEALKKKREAIREGKEYKLLGSSYELRSGDEVFAKMCKKRSATGFFASLEKSTTIGETTDGCRTVKYYPRGIVATEVISQAEVAFLQRGHKLSLTFSDGRVLTRKPWGWFGRVWLNDEGVSLIHVGSLWRGNPVTIEPAGFSLPELSLLIILDRYLIELERAEYSQDVARGGGVTVLSDKYN
jgi:hypothetical protein